MLRLIAILLLVVALSLRRFLLRLCPRLLGVKGYTMKLANPNPNPNPSHVNIAAHAPVVAWRQSLSHILAAQSYVRLTTIH